MAISINELRIGNYITLCGYDIDLNGQKISDPAMDEVIMITILELININDDDICYSPIPLTEEWLLRFGFALIKYGNIDYLSKNIEPETEYNPDLYIYVHFKGSELMQSGITSGEIERDDEIELERTYLLNKIQYVHQLQNLYFALTGKELQSNITKYEQLSNSRRTP